MGVELAFGNRVRLEKPDSCIHDALFQHHTPTRKSAFGLGNGFFPANGWIPQSSGKMKNQFGEI